MRDEELLGDCEGAQHDAEPVMATLVLRLDVVDGKDIGGAGTPAVLQLRDGTWAQMERELRRWGRPMGRAADRYSGHGVRPSCTASARRVCPQVA